MRTVAAVGILVGLVLAMTGSRLPGGSQGGAFGLYTRTNAVRVFF